MNKVIKELYRRAHTTRYYDGDPALDGNPPTVYWQDEVSANRFAELIVQECIDVVDVGGEFVSRPKMVERLKKHFGVEE